MELANSDSIDRIVKSDSLSSAIVLRSRVYRLIANGQAFDNDTEQWSLCHDNY